MRAQTVDVGGSGLEGRDKILGWKIELELRPLTTSVPSLPVQRFK
jgi:hypothetical protein